jgi:hypothetical protein
MEEVTLSLQESILLGGGFLRLKSQALEPFSLQEMGCWITAEEI